MKPPASAGPGSEVLVSVIVPCYRLARYLPAMAESVIAQDYRTWECIIVNDGSPDETRAIATGLVRRDRRIRYVEQENGGPGSARNRGLAHAQGRFVKFLDADDLLLPEALRVEVEAARDVAARSVVISDYWLMDETGRMFENVMCSPEFRLETPLTDMVLRWETELSIPPHAFLFDAWFFREAGVRFGEALPLLGHEDWDCWTQVFLLNPIIRRIRAKLAIYRVRADSVSRDEERNWRGFRHAIDLRIKACSGDTTLRRMLTYKRKLTDDFYGKTWRVRVLGRLRRSQWFGSAVPRWLQQTVYRRLDLHDLRAHGWR
jgi:glycosyltransferase involved in cell wall biosynthesis